MKADLKSGPRLQDFILRSQALSTYRQALRLGRSMMQQHSREAGEEFRRFVRHEAEQMRREKDPARIRALIQQSMGQLRDIQKTLSLSNAK